MSTPKVQIVGHIPKVYVIPYANYEADGNKQDVIDALESVFDDTNAVIFIRSGSATIPAQVYRQQSDTLLVYVQNISPEEGIPPSDMKIRYNRISKEITLSYGQSYVSLSEYTDMTLDINSSNAPTAGSVKQYVDEKTTDIPNIYVVPFYTSPTDVQVTEMSNIVSSIKALTDEFFVFINVNGKIIPAEYVDTGRQVNITAVSHNETSILYRITVKSTGTVTTTAEGFFVTDMNTAEASRVPTVQAVALYIDEQIVNGVW